MNKVHTMPIGIRNGETERFLHRCLGCDTKWITEHRDVDCECGATHFERPDQEDRLDRWIRQLGIHASNRETIKDIFGYPPHICSRRREWEKGVILFVRKNKNG